MCAVLVWYALERGEDPPWRRLVDFWQDNSAKGWAEVAFNQLLVELVRMINSGLLPTFQLSPASAAAQSLMQFATMGLREKFTSFKTLLEAHVDFAEIASWGPRAKILILMVGAANVTTGMLTKLSRIGTRNPRGASARLLRGADYLSRSCRSARMSSGMVFSPTIRRYRKPTPAPAASVRRTSPRRSG